ncbi:MAG: hypothetical protein K0U37_00890 [Gammaproteobacteria bacterium]|nr:hypothetical protein [Gammaproteobacteria bacterium]
MHTESTPEIKSIKTFTELMHEFKTLPKRSHRHYNPATIFDNVEHNFPQWVTSWVDLQQVMIYVPDERLEIFFEIMQGKLTQYVNNQMVFDAISANLESKKYKTLIKHLILNINSIQQWKKCSNYYPADMLQDMMQTQASQLVTSAEEVYEAIHLLRYPSVSKVSTFLDTMTDKLPGLISSKKAFNTTAKCIPLECFPQFLHIMQAQLPQFIDSAETLFELIYCLSNNKKLNILLNFIQNRLLKLLTSVEDFQMLAKCLPNEELITVFDALQEKLLTSTTSAEKLGIILKVLPDERVDLFLNRIENKLHLLVASAKDIGTIGELLSNERFKLFLTRIQMLLLKHIKSATDVQNVVTCFSNQGRFFEGRDERLDSFLNAIEDTLPELASCSVEAFQMIASYLSETMLSKFSNVMQDKLPEQITSVEAFDSVASKYFFTGTHPTFFNLMQMKLLELINSAENLGRAIQKFQDTQGMTLFINMKPKLLNLLVNEDDVVILLEYTAHVPGLHLEVAKYLQDANPELLSAFKAWYSDDNALEKLFDTQMTMS